MFSDILRNSGIFGCQEREERIESGKKAYEVWKKEKDSVISDKDLKKRKEAEKVKMEEEKKKQKKEEASLVISRSLIAFVCFCF